MHSPQRTDGARRSLTTDAQVWAQYARQQGARFDVDAKADEALRFSEEGGAQALGIASKLVRTSEYQRSIHVLQFHEADRCGTPLEPLVEGGHIYLTWQGYILGRVQEKHARWLRPLLPTRCIRFYLLSVTGGVPGKPTRGINFAMAHAPRAIQAKRRGYGFRVRPKATT